jgi:hypothetical protein
MVRRSRDEDMRYQDSVWEFRQLEHCNGKKRKNDGWRSEPRWRDTRRFDSGSSPRVRDPETSLSYTT